MRFVGIDPGRTGALVVVGDDGQTALDVLTWAGQDMPPAGIVQRLVPGDVVALEDQYIGAGAHASKTLHEWTVRLLVQLPDDVTVMRPLASSWRAKVFRRARLRRAAAKRLAIAACREHSGLADELAAMPDVAEAWAMARYAWGWAQHHLAAP